LSNPHESILKDGGKILFAVYKGEVIGVAALKKAGKATMELTKVSVDENYRGMGAGKMLCDTALKKAKELSMSKVILFSHSSLKPALGMYKKLGFKEIPLEDDEYERTDIQMELEL
jgi:ribosomal protein S18 acetylase RimI-like enzyme